MTIRNEIPVKLNAWANKLAGRFNSPVWLVGSALYKDDPRDIDVIIILPDTEFYNRYDCTAFDTQRLQKICTKYWEDMAKLGAWAHRNISLNIDLKIQDESYSKVFGDKDRVRMDNLDLENDIEL